MEPISAGYYAGLGAQREPEVRLLPARLADKAWRRDTDDRQRRFANGEGLAEHVGAPSEAPLPIGVTDHSVSGLGAIGSRREHAAECCRDA